MRFVADVPPIGFDYKLVPPTLEDLYIYLFEEVNQLVPLKNVSP